MSSAFAPDDEGAFAHYNDYVYLSRRLQDANRASQVNVPVRFALARSPADDDVLEQTAAMLGGPEYGSSGWGVSEMLTELLSTKPKSIPVEDLSQLQVNLVKQGYLPPDHPQNGIWDSLSASALRRSDRDAKERISSGHHWLAAPVSAGVEFISQTIPSNVLKNIIGGAKGIVKQGGETAERVGALGGAAAGAAIGTAIAPGVGSAIGAVAGGLAGFAADFFGDDDEDSEGSNRLIDALTPFEEYAAQGPKAFFEDLGFVASAVAIIRGAQLATAGVNAGVQQAALRGAWTKMTPVQPGWATRVVGAGMRPFSSKAAKTWIDLAKVHGLRAQESRPLIQAIRGAYSGASRAGIGVHYAGGLGSGDSKTTIEREIEGAPELPTWVDNTVGLLLNPDGFLPTKTGEVANSLKWAMGDVNLSPYVMLAQKRTAQGVPATQKAKELALNALGPDDLARAKSDVLLRFSYGQFRRAGEMLHKQGRVGDEFEIEKLLRSAKSSLVRRTKKEAAEGSSSLANDLMRYSYDEPMGFAAFLQGLDANGSGIDKVTDWTWAQFEAQRIARAAEEGLESVEVLGGPGRRAIDFDTQAARRQISTLKTQIEGLKKKAGREMDPNVAVELNQEARELQTRVDELAKSLKPNPTLTKKKPLTLVPVLKGDPVSGAGGSAGYASRQDIQGLAKQYRTLSAKVRTSYDTYTADLDNTELARRHFSERDELNLFVDDLAHRGLVPQDLEPYGKRGEPTDSIAKHLEKKAKLAGRDVVVDPKIAQAFDQRGYKLVAVGDEDMLFVNDLERLWEAHGVGDYTRRAAFFETLGLSPIKHSNDSLWALKQAHTQAELETVLARSDVKLTGRQALDKLRDYLVEHNHGKGVQGIGPAVLKEGDSALWKRVSLYKIDVRELKHDDIVDALKLENAAEDPYDVAGKVFAAVKRGGALGADAQLMHPLDSFRLLKRAIRAESLPGITDFMRTAHLDSVEKVAKGYSYLPDKLHRANMALRYSLSPVFDAGRYLEQNTLGFLKAELPPMFAPKKYIERTFGKGAWQRAVSYWDELNGTNVLQVVDDIDRRMFQAGMLGFSPRNHEAAQAFILKQRGWSDDKIRETVSEIGRYGLGRTGAEKAVNFVFFPFSFVKKYVTSLGDAVLQAPARNLLIHEGFRRYHESSLDERFHEFVEDKLPLAEQLRKINTLAYGISPGRFFLEGLTDNKSKAGKAAQLISSVLVPSGAATPVAQAAGGVGDIAANLFVPVVVSGEEDIRGLGDILDRYIPAVRDIDSFMRSLGAQKTVITEGKSPSSQFQDYLDEKRETGAPYDGLAQAMGYASKETLFASPGGEHLKAQLDQEEMGLADKYPSGFAMSLDFTNTAELDRKALYDLAQKPRRSKAEDAILEITRVEEDVKALAAATNQSQETAFNFFAPEIRRRALEHVEDPRFVDLWNRFFSDRFGPLRVTKAA